MWLFFFFCFHLSFPSLNDWGLIPCKIPLQVLFVCTANVVEMIPNPLLDRMEVISIAGYITDEKMHIARDYLEKTTREACGIKPEQVISLPLTCSLCPSPSLYAYCLSLSICVKYICGPFLISLKYYVLRLK